MKRIIATGSLFLALSTSAMASSTWYLMTALGAPPTYVASPQVQVTPTYSSFDACSDAAEAFIAANQGTSLVPAAYCVKQ